MTAINPDFANAMKESDDSKALEKRFLKRNKKTFVKEQDDEGMTALMWAAYYGREQCVKILLEQSGQLIATGSSPAPINFKAHDGNTALHWGAANSDPSEATTSSPNDDVCARHAKCCKMLVGAGASVFESNNDQMTPFERSQQYGQKAAGDELAECIFKMFKRRLKATGDVINCLPGGAVHLDFIQVQLSRIEDIRAKRNLLSNAHLQAAPVEKVGGPLLGFLLPSESMLLVSTKAQRVTGSALSSAAVDGMLYLTTSHLCYAVLADQGRVCFPDRTSVTVERSSALRLPYETLLSITSDSKARKLIIKITTGLVVQLNSVNSHEQCMRILSMEVARYGMERATTSSEPGGTDARMVKWVRAPHCMLVPDDIMMHTQKEWNKPLQVPVQEHSQGSKLSRWHSASTMPDSAPTGHASNGSSSLSGPKLVPSSSFCPAAPCEQPSPGLEDLTPKTGKISGKKQHRPQTPSAPVFRVKKYRGMSLPVDKAGGSSSDVGERERPSTAPSMVLQKAQDTSPLHEDLFNADKMPLEQLRLFADLSGDGNAAKQWEKMVMLCREEAKYRAIWTVVFLCRGHVDTCLSGMLGQIAVFRQHRHRKAAHNLHEMISVAQGYCRILHGQASAPQFTPASGASFPSRLQVVLEVPGKNKKSDAIGTGHKYKAFFTLDGTIPHLHSHEYNGPIHVTANTTIKAIVSAEGVENSEVSVAEYFRAMPLPRIEQDDDAVISMHCDGADQAEIRFTTCLSTEEGEEPTFASSLYSQPFVLGPPGAYTVRMLACRRNCNPSPVATERVVISEAATSSSASTRPSNTSTLTVASVLSSDGSSDDLCVSQEEDVKQEEEEEEEEPESDFHPLPDQGDGVMATDLNEPANAEMDTCVDSTLEDASLEDSVLAMPEPPCVIHSTCSTLTIAWLPVDNATGYCLAWRIAGGESEQEVNYACGGQLISACSCVLGADADQEQGDEEGGGSNDVLLADSQYQVMLCAANEEQWSSWSTWSDIGQTCSQDEPPEAPCCAQMLPLTASSLLVVLPMQNNCTGLVATFKPEDAPEGDLFVYANEENVVIEPVYVLGHNSESEVLMGGTSYVMQLVAANGVGWSAWSSTSKPCSTLGSDRPLPHVSTGLHVDVLPVAMFMEVLDRTYSCFPDNESSPHPWIFSLAECLAKAKESQEQYTPPEMVHTFLSNTMNPHLYSASLRTALMELSGFEGSGLFKEGSRI